MRPLLNLRPISARKLSARKLAESERTSSLSESDNSNASDDNDTTIINTNNVQHIMNDDSIIQSGSSRHQLCPWIEPGGGDCGAVDLDSFRFDNINANQNRDDRNMDEKSTNMKTGPVCVSGPQDPDAFLDSDDDDDGCHQSQDIVHMNSGGPHPRDIGTYTIAPAPATLSEVKGKDGPVDLDSYYDAYVISNISDIDISPEAQSFSQVFPRSPTSVTESIFRLRQQHKPPPYKYNKYITRNSDISLLSDPGMNMNNNVNSSSHSLPERNDPHDIDSFRGFDPHTIDSFSRSLTNDPQDIDSFVLESNNPQDIDSFVLETNNPQDVDSYWNDPQDVDSVDVESLCASMIDIDDYNVVEYEKKKQSSAIALPPSSPKQQRVRCSRRLCSEEELFPSKFAPEEEYGEDDNNMMFGSTVFLHDQHGTPYHRGPQCSAKPNTPAWKRSTQKSTSNNDNTNNNQCQKTRFIDQALGLPTAVTELTHRRYTRRNEIPELYYTKAEIKMIMASWEQDGTMWRFAMKKMVNGKKKVVGLF